MVEDVELHLLQWFGGHSNLGTWNGSRNNGQDQSDPMKYESGTG